MARPRTSLGPTASPLKEADLSRTIQIALCARGHRLWRFNVGLLHTPDGRPIRIGVKGASDLIGIAWGGRFLSIEVKRPSNKKPPTKRQEDWIAMVIKVGGRAGVARSIEEAIKIAEEG